MPDVDILFSGPMIPPILRDEKTQTRRLLKPQPWAQAQSGHFVPSHIAGDGEVRKACALFSEGLTCEPPWAALMPAPCRYGSPGDRLRVRETFYAYGRWETYFDEKKGQDALRFVDMTLECGKHYLYAADKPEVPAKQPRGATPAWHKRPAIHMPRVASRISLVVEQVRVAVQPRRSRNPPKQRRWHEQLARDLTPSRRSRNPRPAGRGGCQPHARPAGAGAGVPRSADLCSIPGTCPAQRPHSGNRSQGDAHAGDVLGCGEAKRRRTESDRDSDRTAAICRAAVTQRGHELLSVPEHLRTTDLCRAAVEQDGRALEFVPELLRTPALCSAAMRSHAAAAKFVPEEAFDDEELRSFIVEHWDAVVDELPLAKATAIAKIINSMPAPRPRNTSANESALREGTFSPQLPWTSQPLTEFGGGRSLGQLWCADGDGMWTVLVVSPGEEHVFRGPTQEDAALDAELDAESPYGSGWGQVGGASRPGCYVFDQGRLVSALVHLDHPAAAQAGQPTFDLQEQIHAGLLHAEQLMRRRDPALYEHLADADDEATHALEADRLTNRL